MTHRMREIREHVRAVLEQNGVTECEFEWASSHQRVVFHAYGQRIQFVFPGTPGDRRALLNTTTDLKKRLRAAAARAPVPGAPADRPVLDARRVLPRKSHDVGGRRARPHEDKRAILYAGYSGNGAPSVADLYAAAARSLQRKV